MRKRKLSGGKWPREGIVSVLSKTNHIFFTYNDWFSFSVAFRGWTSYLLLLQKSKLELRVVIVVAAGALGGLIHIFLVSDQLAQLQVTVLIISFY